MQATTVEAQTDIKNVLLKDTKQVLIKQNNSNLSY